jgi:hypothetical protein
LTKISYPEVGDFLQKDVVKGEEIDCNQYLKLVGVSEGIVKTPVMFAFVVGKKPYVKIDKENNQGLAQVPDNENEFINAMGLQNNDIILRINDVKLETSDLMSIFGGEYKLKEGKPMVIKVNRNGQIIELRGNAKINYVNALGYIFQIHLKWI